MGSPKRLTVVALITLVIIVKLSRGIEVYEEGELEYKWPTVGISILIRNKADSLPYFFSCLNQLLYPKDRLYIWIYSDYNEDNSAEIIEEWKKNYAKHYNGVYVTVDRKSGPFQKDQNKSTEWTPERYKHVIQLREKAIDFAKKKWTDYIFMLDADVFLTHPETLKSLVQKDYLVVAPMLISDGMYSNFWGGMLDNYFYERTESYMVILHREKLGCFHVPMVHSAVLISLKTKPSGVITYDPDKIPNYDGPPDDIIAFAVNAQKIGVNLTVCNDLDYGFISIPVGEKDNFTTEQEQVLNVKIEALGRGLNFPLSKDLSRFVSYPKKSKYGVSEIFMINLERRVERRQLMEQSFMELGMDVTLFNAVDGKKLDLKDLHHVGVTLLPHYEDPYHRRPMKAGEVGCFLSHYYIWKEISKQHLSTTLVLEDDIHFVPYFKQRFLQLLDEIKTMDWDLVYIGRKILLDGKEERVSELMTKPLYSYWTLGYLISEMGARKLIMAEPLSKMLPVDEFLPIMFDQHPNTTWKTFFPNRTLKAYSAVPLLVHPTHYTGDAGYISDTEDSTVVTPTPRTSKQPRSVIKESRPSLKQEPRKEL